MYFLCSTFFKFLVHEWALNPWGLVFLSESVEVDFTPTLFESSLAVLKVGSVVLGANDSNEDDKGGYDTNEDPLDLIIMEFEISGLLREEG